MKKNPSMEAFRERQKTFVARIERQIDLYEKIFEDFKDAPFSIISLNETPYARDAIKLFGPCLAQSGASVDLTSIYRVSFHPPSGSLIVANQGAAFLAQSPFSKSHFVVCQIGAAIYQPMSGLESVNIGITGNIYNGEVVLRSESACPPSFLFGSQRCNCCYQWMSIRELAACLNPVGLPNITDSEEFERWVAAQYTIGQRCIPQTNGPGVLMLHFDSQSGMGNGWTEGEFCHDLFCRSSLRQLGENSVEHLHHTSIKDGYGMLGLPPDGRKKGDGAGYQLTSIVLDFLEVTKNLIVLSNNKDKLNFLNERGYFCRRVKSLGQVLQAGMREAMQRHADYAHQDIGKACVSFEEEMQRLKEEILT